MHIRSVHRGSRPLLARPQWTTLITLQRPARAGVCTGGSYALISLLELETRSGLARRLAGTQESESTAFIGFGNDLEALLTELHHPSTSSCARACAWVWSRLGPPCVPHARAQGARVMQLGQQGFQIVPRPNLSCRFRLLSPRKPASKSWSSFKLEQ